MPFEPLQEELQARREEAAELLRRELCLAEIVCRRREHLAERAELGVPVEPELRHRAEIAVAAPGLARIALDEHAEFGRPAGTRIEVESRCRDIGMTAIWPAGGSEPTPLCYWPGGLRCDVEDVGPLRPLDVLTTQRSIPYAGREFLRRMLLAARVSPRRERVTKVSQLAMVACVNGWRERLIGRNLLSAPPGFPRLLQLSWGTRERMGGAAELTHKRYAAALGGFVRRGNRAAFQFLRCGTSAARRGR